jgi:hypothetical protein
MAKVKTSSLYTFHESPRFMATRGRTFRSAVPFLFIGGVMKLLEIIITVLTTIGMIAGIFILCVVMLPFLLLGFILSLFEAR